MTHCTATSKRTGKPCRAKAMANGTCYHHGGKSPRGAASPHFVSGRYSKDLPTRLAARYEDARTDPDLLNLSAEIQLTYALLGEALTGMDRGESGALWRTLQVAWETFQEADRAQDQEGSQLALATMGDLITRGAADAAARAEVLAIIERRRKLVESEGKRRAVMQQMITAERLMVLVAAVVDVVMRHVDDAGVRSAISADIGALLSRVDSGRD